MSLLSDAFQRDDLDDYDDEENSWEYDNEDTDFRMAFGDFLDEKTRRLLLADEVFTTLI
jgi:hypothetical protein